MILTTVKRVTILQLLVVGLIIVQFWITYCSIAAMRVQLFYNGHIPAFLNDNEIDNVPFYVANDFDILVFFLGLPFFVFFLYPLLFSGLVYVWKMPFKQRSEKCKIAGMLTVLCLIQIGIIVLLVFYFGDSFFILIE
jgi:hypothetical protein